MFKTKLVRSICLVIVLLMAFSTLSACGSSNEKKVTESQAATGATSSETARQPEPLLEYSFYQVSDAPPTYVDESTDIVTPYNNFYLLVLSRLILEFRANMKT